MGTCPEQRQNGRTALILHILDATRVQHADIPVIKGSDPYLTLFYLTTHIVILSSIKIITMYSDSTMGYYYPFLGIALLNCKPVLREDYFSSD